MRPSINPYAIEGEAPRYTTPALDELARTGTLFTRAYIQISYCAPSRNSFMSGRRPDSSNIYSFIGTFRDPASGQHWVALPEHFVQQPLACDCGNTVDGWVRRHHRTSASTLHKRTPGTQVHVVQRCQRPIDSLRERANAHASPVTSHQCGARANVSKLKVAVCTRCVHGALRLVCRDCECEVCCCCCGLLASVSCAIPPYSA